MRRNLVKLIVLGALLVLTPITFMLRRGRKSTGSYQWVDTPGENIPLPDEVSGQVGSEVCASPDGQFIAVAGNRVIPQEIFAGQKVEVTFHLLAYKHFIYLSSDFGKSFECVYRSPRSGGIAGMTCSPVNPHQIAFISVEFQTNFPVPETSSEMSRMAQDSQLRAKLADDFMYAVEIRDFDVALYVLDTESKAPPRKLCSLDNIPWMLSGKPKTDLSRLNENQLKYLNEMQSFKESGIYVPWKERLRTELQSKSVTWLPDGKGLLVTDGFSISKIDLSGNKSPFYSPDPKNAFIVGNLCCRTSGDVSFVEFDRSIKAVCLTRLNMDGNVLSKTQGAFSHTRANFDESLTPLVGENKLAMTGNKSENLHGAFLQISSLPPNVDDWKDTVDWKDHAKSYDIYDHNSVQFYYLPKAFLYNDTEILLFKRRAYILDRPLDHPNWEVTQWTVENAAVPWVELRKMKIS